MADEFSAHVAPDLRVAHVCRGTCPGPESVVSVEKCPACLVAHGVTPWVKGRSDECVQGTDRDSVIATSPYAGIEIQSVTVQGWGASGGPGVSGCHDRAAVDAGRERHDPRVCCGMRYAWMGDTVTMGTPEEGSPPHISPWKVTDCALECWRIRYATIPLHPLAFIVCRSAIYTVVPCRCWVPTPLSVASAAL
jgi:hypothetical protein